MHAKRTAPFILTWIVLGILLGSAACTLYKLEQKLSPPYAEFLSQVRYIITSAEREAFLTMPDEKKPAFIEEFWKRRDPDPETADNEFKADYLARIQRANQMFIGEGTPGWLTDRGRVFVLFGPPSNRNNSPMGNASLGRCAEIWYYGDFPVVFIDQTCSGTYRLSTFDLSPLREVNIAYAGAINRAFDQAQTPGAPPRESGRLFDYQTELAVTERGPKRIAASLRLQLPYEKIWFKSEGRRMKTSFEVAWEIRDAQKNIAAQGRTTFAVDLAEAELPAKAGQNFVMTVPLALEDEAKIAALGQGPAALTVSVVNATGKETQKKTIEFK
jgi:GWxTD domain-containing protein